MFFSMEKLMKFYKPKHFRTEELVHPEIFKRFGENSLQFLDARMLWTLDAFREVYGSITINNWCFGGKRVDSGLRLSLSETGAPFSAHKFGRAFDLIIKNISAETIRQEMKSYPSTERFQYITRCEEGVSWLHIDNLSIPQKSILFFQP